ncbi:MAG: hypothetical protein IPM57_09210 [Oligoflexia bacterium]|nr:hypothetical protein [Oligoflexia bacterium]
MKRHIVFLFLVICIGLTNGGGCNMFGDLSNKNSDEAIIEDVKKFIDRQMWTDAINKWQLLSPGGQALRANKVILASAYAGWGGLNTVTLFTSLGNMGSSTLFAFLMDAFKGKTTADFDKQVIAEGIMQTISVDAADRTADENIFLLFIEFAKIGTLLAGTGDLDGDGAVDATYENCTDLTATQGAHIATGIGNIIDILTVTGTSLAGSTLSDIQTNFCTPFPAVCAMKQVSDVDAAGIQVGKTLAGESNLGIGLAAPTNDPYCQLSTTPIDPTVDTGCGIPGCCPNNTATASPICP